MVLKKSWKNSDFFKQLQIWNLEWDKDHNLRLFLKEKMPTYKFLTWFPYLRLLLAGAMVMSFCPNDIVPINVPLDTVKYQDSWIQSKRSPLNFYKLDLPFDDEILPKVVVFQWFLQIIYKENEDCFSATPKSPCSKSNFVLILQ